MVTAFGLLLASSLRQTSVDADLAFLRSFTQEVLNQSRVAPGSNGPVGWPIKNSVGFSLVTPGRRGYPAFWIRDFSMACDSSLVPPDEIENHFKLVGQCQNGPNTRKLKSGGVLPPFCIPDHVNFDGTAVYYPGTYSSGEDQGAEPWGTFPPADDHFEFVHMGWLLTRMHKSGSSLNEKVLGLTMLDRMERAFLSPEFDKESGLFVTSEKARAVGFGFCDSISVTGKVLYPSLLRFRAAKELYEITKKKEYSDSANAIAKSIGPTFGEPGSGWLIAATGIGRQPDVWGTLLALHLGVLDSDRAKRARQTIVEAFRAGTISSEGAVRHVPSDRDYSFTSAWEKAMPAKGIYQNGAYWHTPTGFLIEALMKEDRSLGRQAFVSYINHLRRGGEIPWECFNPSLKHTQNGGYLASVAWPYYVLKSTF